MVDLREKRHSHFRVGRTSPAPSVNTAEPIVSCVLCGEPDTKDHEVFHCPHLQDLRQQYDSLFRLIGDLPLAFRNFGLVETQWHGWLIKAGL